MVQEEAQRAVCHSRFPVVWSPTSKLRARGRADTLFDEITGKASPGQERKCPAVPGKRGARPVGLPRRSFAGRGGFRFLNRLIGTRRQDLLRVPLARAVGARRLAQEQAGHLTAALAV